MWTRLHKRTSYGEISKFFSKTAGDNLHLCKRALVSKFCSTSYASWTFRATATAASGFALGLAMLGGDGSLIPANCDQAPAPPAKLAASYDFVVVGAGVAGLSALFGILSVRPGSRVLVVDSDADALLATLADPVPELRALQDQHGPVERLPGVQFAPGVAAVRLDPEVRALALQGGAVTTLKLQTLEGSLQLNGDGEWSATRLHFVGTASAAPERQAALANLLNIIGRRNGDRSIISVG